MDGKEIFENAFGRIYDTYNKSVDYKEERRNIMLGINKFIKEEDGVGVVEMILIVVVIIGLVIIFKNSLTSIVNDIFETIKSRAGEV